MVLPLLLLFSLFRCSLGSLRGLLSSEELRVFVILFGEKESERFQCLDFLPLVTWVRKDNEGIRVLATNGPGCYGPNSILWPMINVHAKLLINNFKNI